MTATLRRPCRAAMAWAFLAAALMTGCAGGERPQTRLYLLSPLPADTPAVSAAGPDPVSLDIAVLRLPQYLDRPQIVTRSTDNRITLAEYDQWGGNLGKNMTRVLARNLSRLLATPEITIFSRRPPRPADVRIDVEVLAFERGPDGRVHLSAQWRLRRGEDASPALSRVSELASPPLASTEDMAATVAEMSALWGEIAREMAAAITSLRS